MERFLGEIILVPFDRTPRGFLPCDGRVLSFGSDHRMQALYSLIGNKWGGNPGQATFALPDLRDKGPAPALRYMICCDGEFPMGDD
ncbi:microcystin-dependent protein [Azospirillum agricola]|uniref:phage tail protein n=1 Tax=Azospirillum agricola TaxID=1720247 RepID=UPI001AE4D098|nr:tail fiber protein [Azospirillum agricola]MBP2227473.1 microcystin-dependent protein [Azospirillum agricola]